MSSLLNRLTRQLSGGVSSAENVAASLPAHAEKATVAAGCFWGVEHIYRKHFTDKGLLDARVGYTGGDVKNPSYAKVCGGGTGHAEALQIIYDPKILPYRTIIEFFYRIHDPTTLNRQGADGGTQYRSAIFYHSPEQKAIADDVTKMAQENWWNKVGKITTVIIGGDDWYDAEKYHQKYLDHNPGGYECPTHYVRGFKLPEGYPADEKKEETVAPAEKKEIVAPDTATAAPVETST